MGPIRRPVIKEALELGADVVIMLHPDYQYTPKLILAMGSLIAIGQYDIVLGSRILCGSTIRGGMPIYRYFANRLLTLIQILVTGAKLSEYQSGYRSFSKEVLLNLPLEENSDDFIFDNQMLLQAINFKYSIGEISCPAKYFEDASSINLTRSMKYGLGVLWTTLLFICQKIGVVDLPLFSENGKKLEQTNSEK